jgi:RNA polymerase sigma-70 factor (ECF subfamily)
MTTCRGVLDSLSDYLEGDVGKAVCGEIEKHLEGCEACRMHVDNMKQIVTLYKKWRDDPIPDDVSVRLQGVLSEVIGGPGAKGGERGKARKRAKGAGRKSPRRKTDPK